MLPIIIGGFSIFGIDHDGGDPCVQRNLGHPFQCVEQEELAEALAVQGLGRCEAAKSDDRDAVGIFVRVWQAFTADFADGKGVEPENSFWRSNIKQDEGTGEIFLGLLASHFGQPFVQRQGSAVEAFAVMP